MKNILISGAGAMGSQITSVCLKAFPSGTVFLSDVSKDQLQKAQAQIDKWKKKDRLKNPKLEFANLELVENFIEVGKKFDLIIEAASENIEIKKKLFQEYNKVSDNHSLITSNTSSLSLTRMANQLEPEKRKNTLGLHFFNPARIMQLVEIIETRETSAEAIAKSKKIVQQMGKKDVVCKDAPGFITSRLGIVMINEALFILQEGIASAEDIDTGIKLGYNHPMGPLKLADFVGLDVVFAVTQTLYENFQDSKYRPPMILRKMVEAGHLGRKTGRGIFQYEKED